MFSLISEVPKKCAHIESDECKPKRSGGYLALRGLPRGSLEVHKYL
jgi:hypothetical protein